MIWLLVTGAAVITAVLAIWLGKLPGASRPLLGAAIMLGMAGYALQGHPALPGKPVQQIREPEGFGDRLADRQQGMADRFGPATMWISMSDGFMRTGKTELAAQTLEKGLGKYPDNVDLWVGLGNALVAHGGGMMSPASALAFDEAMKREPNHPAPPFFAGLAMAQSGDFAGAERVWDALLQRTPENAPWADDLRLRLGQLREAMGKAPVSSGGIASGGASSEGGPPGEGAL